MDFRWPEATWTATTIIGQQEYALVEMVDLLRVYVAGQILPKTSIPNLEGDQIQLFDQTAPNFIPQWVYQGTLSYPVSSDTGGPFGMGLPWQSGDRPQYYKRGGNLGIVPPPANAVTIQIDGVPVANTLVQYTDQTILPYMATDAICWKTLMLTAVGEQKLQDAAQYDTAYKGALALLLSWRKTWDPWNGQIFPITNRSKRQGPPRYGSGKGSYGGTG
jgi:hypothetical protein